MKADNIATNSNSNSKPILATTMIDTPNNASSTDEQVRLPLVPRGDTGRNVSTSSKTLPVKSSGYGRRGNSSKPPLVVGSPARFNGVDNSKSSKNKMNKNGRSRRSPSPARAMKYPSGGGASNGTAKNIAAGSAAKKGANNKRSPAASRDGSNKRQHLNNGQIGSPTFASNDKNASTSNEKDYLIDPTPVKEARKMIATGRMSLALVAEGGADDVLPFANTDGTEVVVARNANGGGGFASPINNSINKSPMSYSKALSKGLTPINIRSSNKRGGRTPLTKKALFGGGGGVNDSIVEGELNNLFAGFENASFSETR